MISESLSIVLIIVAGVWAVVGILSAVVASDNGADDREAWMFGTLWPLYLIRGFYRFLRDAFKEFLNS